MTKIKYGICDVHVAKRTQADGSATPTYATPVAIPGAVSLTIDRTSNRVDFYADNVLYYTSLVKSKLTSEVEVADIARTILTGFLNYKTATEGGILETNDDKLQEFALLFRVETDVKARKFCMYNCTAVESSESYSTKEENVSPVTSTLSVTCAGEKVGDYVVFKHVVEASDSNYDEFFTEVTIPTISNT